MINLFKYFFKKRINVLIALSIVVTAVFVIIVVSTPLIEQAYFPTLDQSKDVPNTYVLVAYPIVIFILAFFIPFYEFSFKMKKIGIDQMYSLPLKREKIYFVKYLIGLCEIIIPFMIGSFISFFVIMNLRHMYNLSAFVPYFFALMACSIGVFTIVSCVFIHQNTELDGVVNSLFAFFLLPAIISAANALSYVFFDQYLRVVPGNHYFLFSPLVLVHTGMSSFFGKSNGYISTSLWSYAHTIAMIVFVAISIGAFLFSYYHIKNEKSENSQQISSSLLGYRLFLPILGVSLSIVIFEINELLFLYQIAVYFGYVLYLRKFKLNKKYTLVVVLLIVTSLVFCLCLRLIK